MRRVYLMPLLVFAALSACDTVRPDASDQLVVQAFLDAGQPPPLVTVRKTTGLRASEHEVIGAIVSDAIVDLRVNGSQIPYHRSSSTGQYSPLESTAVLAGGDHFTIDISWNNQTGSAAGRIPPPVGIDSVLLSIPATPVEAVLVDSLRLDSLGIDAQTGYLYAIETTIWWKSPDDQDDYWVQAQLKPFTSFSSLVLDFFLLPEQVFRESDADVLPNGVGEWTGLYALPVQDGDSPLPAHELRLGIVRSNSDYAQYILTSDAPERREPASNLRGALGIVAGISVDSLLVSIDPSHAGKRTRIQNLR